MRGTHTGTFDKVRLAIKGGDWLTSRQIAEVAKLKREQVSVALFGLAKQGRVEQDTSLPRRYRRMP